jgi:tetratricopeptide (TPR) repeat protein
VIENVATLLMAIGSLACGSLGWIGLLAGDWPAALGLHLAAAALGWRAAVVSDKRRLGEHWFQFFVSGCVPFLGGVIAFILSESVKLGRSGALAEEFAVYLNDSASFRESVPIKEQEVPEPGQLVSLADILASPVSEAEQRIAVEHLAGMETPAAIDILHRVIESNTGDSKFFAMTAIGQLEEKLLSKIQRLEEDIKSGRESDSRILIDAARSYLDFSYFQLAQESLRQDYLKRAGELLETALARADCEPGALILLGRVRLLEFDPERALACFDSLLEIQPGDPAGLLWRAEAWYLLGDYAKTREDCLSAARTDRIPDNIRGAVDFWLSGPGEAAAG